MHVQQSPASQRAPKLPVRVENGWAFSSHDFRPVTNSSSHTLNVTESSVCSDHQVTAQKLMYKKNASSQTFFHKQDHVILSTNDNHVNSNINAKPNVSQTSTASQYDITQEVVLSVNQIENPLPVIDIILAKLNFPVLVDSGSSICIISEEFFQSIKSFINYKFLARAVTISTINSKVKFSGCIDLSFKIEKFHFRHNFFLVNMPQKSNFKAILGTDFLKKEAINVDFAENVIKIRGETVPFLQGNNPKVENLQVVQISTVEDIPQNTSLIEQANAKSNTTCHDKQVNVKVKLIKKTIVSPKEKKYLEVKTDNIPNVPEFLFEPVPQTKPIEVNCSLHYANNDGQSSENCSLDQRTGYKHEAKQVNFHILVENLSDKPVHLNKNQVLGEIVQFDGLGAVEECNQQSNIEYNNLIKATDEIYNLREREFNIDNFNITHLSNSQRKVFEEILCEHKQVFASSLKSMGQTDLVVPQLSFTSNYPRRSPPFPIPQMLLKKTKEQLDEMLEAGIISKTISDWSSPLLLVKKKPGPDGKQTYRLALDLRLINTIITQSAYPLPKIADIINNISQYKYYSNLDLQAAYHQINLPEEYRPVLSFNTPFGAYCYNRLVFGMRNSASIFQHLIDKIIDEVNIPGILAYQDDIVVASNSFEETVDKLSKLFSCFEKYNLTLSPSKCNFHSEVINYLGFEISQYLVKPIKQNITKITGFPFPDTKRKLKKFLGLCGFYRHLVPQFAHLTAQLNDLTNPKTKFVWSEENRAAFTKLQEIFFKEPFLRQPNFQEKFFLNTDASSVAISACLLQNFGDELLPVSYFSKTLNKHEKNYPAIKLELMAIVKGIHAFKYYLYNREFVILSDSAPLQHYKQVSSPTDLTTRWLLSISEYNFNFKHIPGQKNVLADYFSRVDQHLPKQDVTSKPSTLISDEILPVEEINVVTHQSNDDDNITFHSKQSKGKQDPLLEISVQTFFTEQQKDKELQVIINKLKAAKGNKLTRVYFISDQNNLLYRDINMSNGKFNPSTARVVVPKSLVPKVLRIMHLGHRGVQKTYEFVTGRYWWKGAFKDTKQFVDTCDICLMSKPQRIPKAPWQNTFLPSVPGEMISMDIVGPFTNKMSILTVIDIFTRHLELYPLHNISANTVTDKFLKYISTHGRPAQVLCDLGKQFTAEIFDRINSVLHINLMHTSVAHPQANGISERINTSIKATIQALGSEGYSFRHAIDLHKAIYNASTHPATGFSPNQVHFARELSLFTDTLELGHISQNTCYNFNLFRVLETMEKVYQMVQNNLEVSMQLNQSRQRRFNKFRKFKCGDIVYVKADSAFKKKIDGPFTICRQTGPVNFLIQRRGNPNFRKFVIHVDRLVLSNPRPDRLREDLANAASTSPHNINSSTNGISFQELSVSSVVLDESSEPVTTQTSTVQFSSGASNADGVAPSCFAYKSPQHLVPGDDSQGDDVNEDVIYLSSPVEIAACSPVSSGSAEIPVLSPAPSSTGGPRGDDQINISPPVLSQMMTSPVSTQLQPARIRPYNLRPRKLK